MNYLFLSLVEINHLNGMKVKDEFKKKRKRENELSTILSNKKCNSTASCTPLLH